ncbi:MAG: hypothetical protein P0Y56_09485 [Candidatus Andeanibacterium colombiense]|uniref:Uncharacterized protein n=1 Tax=Candidatus Andeanibacterium colombiense TaxID=3121345 RepID=A0AAJ5X3P6_9SPHN|nr:MAG: hypothetical protein P0Y56_09485 [Sphingomonadaceae bacterium]
MRKIIAALALSALALGGASAVQAKDKQTGEEKLAKLLDGRVAGDPQSCIATNRTDGMQVIDKTAIVYKDGKTIWVNRTAHPENLDRTDILVIKRFSGSQLCKLDQITTVDQGSGFFTGVVFLQDFVPYKKVEG